jgi:hypothetical protein
VKAETGETEGTETECVLTVPGGEATHRGLKRGVLLVPGVLDVGGETVGHGDE